MASPEQTPHSNNDSKPSDDSSGEQIASSENDPLLSTLLQKLETHSVLAQNKDLTPSEKVTDWMHRLNELPEGNDLKLIIPELDLIEDMQTTLEEALIDDETHKNMSGIDMINKILANKDESPNHQREVIFMMYVVSEIVRRGGPDLDTQAPRNRVIAEIAADDSSLYKTLMDIFNSEKPNTFLQKHWTQTLRLIAKNRHPEITGPIINFLQKEETVPAFINLLKSEVKMFEENEPSEDVVNQTYDGFDAKINLLDCMLSYLRNPVISKDVRSELEKNSDTVVPALIDYYHNSQGVTQESLNNSQDLLNILNPAWRSI